MKQRITFLSPDPQESDVIPVNVTSSGVVIKNLKGAKEHRWSIGLDEIPSQVDDHTVIGTVLPSLLRPTSIKQRIHVIQYALFMAKS